MEFDYEILYRPGRVHQVPDALSRLPQPEPSGSDEDLGEIDDTIPTFRTDVSELVVGVVTRSQSQSQVDDGDEVQEPRAEAPADSPVPPVRARVRRHGARLPTTKDVVRHSRAAKESTEWTDPSFMPLPDEP